MAGGSEVSGSVKSRSSESDELRRIECGGSLHPERGRPVSGRRVRRAEVKAEGQRMKKVVNYDDLTIVSRLRSKTSQLLRQGIESVEFSKSRFRTSSHERED